MDLSQQILEELRSIKQLNRIIAACFLITAISFLWVSSSGDRASSRNNLYRASSDEFTDRGSTLLNEGKAKEVIALAEERERKFPMDPYVYWYRGRAYYQLGQYDAALKATRFADELCPAWRKEYTGPFVQRIKERLSEKSS
jgi:tetratricopeptide (TPR) repeat protein